MLQNSRQGATSQKAVSDHACNKPETAQKEATLALEGKVAAM